MQAHDPSNLPAVMPAVEPCEYHQYCGQNGWRNGLDGKVYCALHNPNPSTPDPALRLFRELLDGGHERFDHAVFSGPFIVGAAAVPHPLHFNGAVFHSDAIFEMTRFGGKVNLHGVDLGGRLILISAKLEGGLSVSNAVVDGDVELFNAETKERTDLVGVRVGGRLSLARSTFSGDVEASRADVRGETRLIGATFDMRASFGEAVFGSAVEAGGTTFAGVAEFTDARFVDGARFTHTEFGAEASFSGAVFEGATVFSGRPESPIFRGTPVHFDGVHVVNADELAFRDADLALVQLAGTDLREAEFTGVRWAEIQDKRFGKRAGLRDEQLIGTSGGAPSFDAVERSYRELKHGYEDRKDYARAGDFHVGEKEMRLRNPATPLGDRALLFFYRLISRYGERVWLPLAWLAGLVVVSAVIYVMSGAEVSIEAGDAVGALDPSSASDWGRGLLYSLRTSVLLIGAVLDGWLGLLNTAQRVLGPILIALAALAVRQRLRR